MSTSFLLLGSNLGNPPKNLASAIALIGQRAGTIRQQSSVYKTAPWGNTDQDVFYNQVLRLETTLDPYELITTVLQIEQEMGRKREQKWEPRIIDIDILFYDDLVLEGNLNIPHPLLHRRRFTLEPLNEIVPTLMHPVLKKSVTELLEICEDTGFVEKM
jgi:2-amino-4-hydroxy-6-hydroxymethyldihydropteridine diphosphokinase